MAKTINDINLLPNKNEGLITQFLNWALSVGRLLIIITETLALGTFLYRFSLDMQLVDLHDHIKSDSFIVRNFQSSEANFRDLQTRLTLARQYSATSAVVPTILKDIITMGKGKVTFTNVTLSPTTATIEVQAPQVGSLSDFVAALKQYPRISSLSIDKVQDQTSSSLVTVAITAKLKTDLNETSVNQTQ